MRLSKLIVLGGIATLVACSAATGGSSDGEIDGAEPDVERGRSELGAGATVADAVKAGCSTSSVKGLSEQIVAQMNCLVPKALAALPSRPNVTKSDATFAYMQPAARDALVKALDAHPNTTLGINSMFRTVAQQYLLYQWGQSKKCGVALAAKPGNSNHESGIALDTNQYSAWKTALESRGFKWFGSSDKVHFDYVGSGTTSLKGVDVEAFQILWNRNHPEDVIGEDGIYGSQTASRLAKTPAAGFPLGAQCAGDSEPAPTPPAEPPPSEPPPPTSTPPSCGGSCGSSQPVAGSSPACYCDGVCVSNNDCCVDYEALCGGTPTPTPSAPSCAGSCGSSSAVPGSNPACYCDSSCATYGDCCSDSALLCGY